MNTDLNTLKEIAEDGRRACRLRKYISGCPAFEDQKHIAAWKAGFRSARDGISLDAIQTNLENILNT